MKMYFVLYRSVLSMKVSYLLVGSGLLHASAKGLRSGVACWTGQTVVAWYGVLTPVHAIELKAGIRDLLTLWGQKEHQGWSE